MAGSAAEFVTPLRLRRVDLDGSVELTNGQPGKSRRSDFELVADELTVQSERGVVAGACQFARPLVEPESATLMGADGGDGAKSTSVALDESTDGAHIEGAYRA